jgi:hypothetical protein
VFEAAGSVLLALTKCNSEGYWIKSMFGDSTDKQVANVQIHTLNDDTSTSKFEVAVNRSNLSSIASYGLPEDIAMEGSWQVLLVWLHFRDIADQVGGPGH